MVKIKIDLISIFHNEEWFFENSRAFGVFDNYPVSEGHMLIIPKRKVSTVSEMREDELLDCYKLIDSAQALAEFRHGATGFNFGVNQGKDAGQTISQLHFHVIPRYNGDVEDPIGGVRNVIPGKGNYRKGDYK